MDQELSEAFDRLHLTVEAKAAENRAAIEGVHGRVTEQGTKVAKEIATHDTESAVRATDLKRDIQDQEREKDRVEKKIDAHTKFHRDQKTNSRGLWLAIGITLLSAMVGMFKDCASNF